MVYQSHVPQSGERAVSQCDLDPGGVKEVHQSKTWLGLEVGQLQPNLFIDNSYTELNDLIGQLEGYYQ
jgi:hypothetical protein